MPRFRDTDEQEDLSSAVALLGKFVEFAEIQEREGLVDGAADPSIYVVIANDLIAKYEIDDVDLEYALEA